MVARTLKATSSHNDSGREGGRSGAGESLVSRVQCARTSPCEHAHHMARRLALLALLACAVLANSTRPPSRPSNATDSLDLALWDDYEESLEKSFPARKVTVKPNKIKVTLKVPNSKFNVALKSTNSGEKNNVIKTTINISSYTNMVVTKSPPTVAATPVTRFPQGTYVSLNNRPLLLDSADQVLISSTKKPIKTRVTTTRRPPKTSRPRITTTTRRPRTTTTRRSTPRTTRRTLKTTKAPKKTKVTCSQKNNPGWMSTYFQDVKIKKSPKKEEKSGWFVGRFYVLDVFC